jgi:flagellar motility protein MotE (MotC chaperone)
MDFHYLQTLRRMHPAWRLLASDHAPMVAGFLHRCFIAANERTLPEQELESRLNDYLSHLREQLGEDAFPKSAREYLTAWAGDDRGWLRRYYPPQSDEPHYDLTPATEKAIQWLTGLEQQQFVGAESRLKLVFELLRQIVEGSEADPEARIRELERRRDAIDAEIAQIRGGRMRLMEPTQLRERFLQAAGTARGLLADFRQVEQNFRDLDRQVREQVATWEGGKGEVLEAIFGDRDAIADSDQGKSFRAFWDFLMSPARQNELTELMERVLALDPVAELEPDRRLARIHYDWLAAGDVTQRTVARLSEQLRRYLDDPGLAGESPDHGPAARNRAARARRAGGAAAGPGDGARRTRAPASTCASSISAASTPSLSRAAGNCSASCSTWCCPKPPLIARAWGRAASSAATGCARNLLMDRTTLEVHRELWGEEPADKRFLGELPRLDPEERALFQDLRADRLGERVRLEQERIGFGWLRKALSKVLASEQR